jgi:peptidoglycan-associated lipoprotein
MDRLHIIAFAAASLALAAGCSAEPKPAPRMAAANMMASDATPRALVAPPPRTDTATPSSGSVHVDQRILKACGDIPIAHFAFDSAAIQPDARDALDAIARCFTTGPLAGKGMSLVGHTDSRGELEYNFALGQRRSGSVADYLISRGVSRGRVTATSHGELDATGTDESGWARDRKVDVLLAE